MYVIPLPHSPALFMTSLIQRAGHRLATLTGVLSPLPRWFPANRTRNLAKGCSLFSFFLFSLIFFPFSWCLCFGQSLILLVVMYLYPVAFFFSFFFISLFTGGFGGRKYSKECDYFYGMNITTHKKERKKKKETKQKSTKNNNNNKEEERLLTILN